MNKSSFFLAVLLIANPFILLFFQNCTVLPHVTSGQPTPKNVKLQTEQPPKSVVHYSLDNSL